MKRILICFFAILAGTLAVLAKDVKTTVVTTTPQMHCANCEKKIKENLRFEKGVKDIQTNVEAQTVTIKYDADKTSVEKLLAAFQKFGYTAREVNKDEKVAKHEGEPCPTGM